MGPHGQSHLNVIGTQLDAVLDLANVASLSNAVIAYEPVRAIGTGNATAVGHIIEYRCLRWKIAEREPETSASVRDFYGGSVKPEKARSLFDMPDVDGGSIGEASLDAKSFLSICHSV